MLKPGISHRLSRTTGQSCGTADKQTGCCSIFEPIIFHAIITFSDLIQMRHEFETTASRSDVYLPKFILWHTNFSTSQWISHLNMDSKRSTNDPFPPKLTGQRRYDQIRTKLIIFEHYCKHHCQTEMKILGFTWWYQIITKCILKWKIPSMGSEIRCASIVKRKF